MADSIRRRARARHGLGDLLRSWRKLRGVSQLELGLRAGFSARHLSFIENGRSQPTSHSVLALAEALDVPLRERNRLLLAAGHLQEYRHTPLSAAEMQRIREVLEFILARHSPYAAVVLDRYSNCLMCNEPYARLRAALVDASLVSDHANHLRVTFHPLGARRFIVNWPQVSSRIFTRVSRELGMARDDEQAQILLADLRSYLGDSMVLHPGPELDPADMLLPIHVRKGQLEFRLFSTMMTLGTPYDVTLQELRIESFFPADNASESSWQLLATDDNS